MSVKSADRPSRRASAGRWFISAGVSLFMMADHIFHNRRELPALIVKKPKPTTARRHTFELPDAPGQPMSPPNARGSRPEER